MEKNKVLKYETRDGNGHDIIKEIPIKEFKRIECNCMCDICGSHIEKGIKVKDAVSSHFTDWAYFKNGVVCEMCSRLFSVYPYCYIYSVGEIELMNVRQIKDKIINSDIIEPPFMFCISTSQKKHLFYRAKMNYSNDTRFAVNLETETIMTTAQRQKELFDFVENLQVLSCTKEMLKSGKISNDIPIYRAPRIFFLAKVKMG